MEFNLPEVYSAADGEISRTKDAYLAHYARLERQRFLHCLILEFQCRTELLSVEFFVCDEKGHDLDVNVNFSEAFDTNDPLNFWEEQAAQNGIISAYVPELNKFCDGKTFSRGDLLDANHLPRFSSLNDLLNAIEAK